MKTYLKVLAMVIMISPPAGAQRKWTGLIDGWWDNPLNWEPSGVPASSDAVLLDNSVNASDYEVTLPKNAVTISSVVINPASGRTIRLVLPAANLASPALVVTDASDAIILNRGAIFQNASGLTSGQSLKIAGNIRINNGGTYIHNTRSAHATDIVAKLSVAEGTEEGVFEFDIPTASSTISLSNRSFGKLKLSAVAYNANVSYSGAGSNPVTIRSDLEIGERVNFSIGFSNVFSIRRNLLQHGGTFNISNDNNATTVALGGNLVQEAGQITETGNATPMLLFNGTVKQDLQLAAGVMNDIIIRMDNAAGAELKTPVFVPYRLELKSGKIKTNAGTLLTLLSNATLQADSLSKSYIEGPLRKEGLNNIDRFLFPVGKSGIQRWVELKKATGNYTVAYKQQNPYDFSTVMGAGIDHVSTIETWTIDADGSPAPTAQVELSFDNVNSGGVSDLNALRVAGWITGVRWSNRGNNGVTGSAGAAGSVISEVINDFSPDRRLFTLASSVSNQNTLPDAGISFTATNEGTALKFNWQISADLPVQRFDIEGSADGWDFHSMTTIANIPGNVKFHISALDNQNDNYFRVKLILKNGPPLYSKTVFLKRKNITLSFGMIVEREQLKLKLVALSNETLTIHVHDPSGRLVMEQISRLAIGDNSITIPIIALKHGLYFLTVYSAQKGVVRKFIKS